MVEGGGAWDGEDIWGEGAAREGRGESSIGMTLLCEEGRWRERGERWKEEGSSREGEKRGGRMEREGRRTEGRRVETKRKK